jgi:hypothetical protein
LPFQLLIQNLISLQFIVCTSFLSFIYRAHKTYFHSPLMTFHLISRGQNSFFEEKQSVPQFWKKKLKFNRWFKKKKEMPSYRSKYKCYQEWKPYPPGYQIDVSVLMKIHLHTLIRITQPNLSNNILFFNVWNPKCSLPSLPSHIMMSYGGGA